MIDTAHGEAVRKIRRALTHWRWNERNPGVASERARASYLANRRKHLDRQAVQRAILRAFGVRQKSYPKPPSLYGFHHRSARRATPRWADRQQIAAVYKEARRLSAETGVPHHVDHIIPLNHPQVCGLHVPANLRAVPAAVNLAKHNSFAMEA